MEKLSAYILTKNSEAHLTEILRGLAVVADEVLVIDSGSSDNTEKITRQFDNARFVYHEFSNFKDQRTFAAGACAHDMVLFLDSDEIPDDEFVEALRKLKQEGFANDAYQVLRNWNVLGRNVRAVYPISAPDFPVRMYRKSKVSFSASNMVHETPSGYETVGKIGGSISHITFQTKEEMEQKLQMYTDIAAQDTISRRKSTNILKVIFSPMAAFFKWYLRKGGYRDGFEGWLLGVYAYRYTLLKYLKARKLVASNRGEDV